MLTRITLAALLAFAFAGSPAQAGQEQRITANKDVMKRVALKSLGLDEARSKKVSEILDSHVEEMRHAMGAKRSARNRIHELAESPEPETKACSAAILRWVQTDEAVIARKKATIEALSEVLNPEEVVFIMGLLSK